MKFRPVFFLATWSVLWPWAGFGGNGRALAPRLEPFLTTSLPPRSDGVFSSGLRVALSSPEGATLAVWVQFRDKGFRTAAELRVRAEKEKAALSERTLRRRRKTMPTGALVDAADLPIEETYVDAVVDAGARIRSRSRWFNAVGVEATPETLRRIARLPFVHRMAPIAREKQPLPVTLPASETPAPKKETLLLPFDYGASATQITQINVDSLHQRGLSGKGVVIGVLDAGFAAFSTRALDQARILDQRDFVDGDNEPYETPDHGTSVLSVIGAFAPGNLIGPAYGASFLLARTEILEDGIETIYEEDLWVEGLEWLEREGADVVNSSLGYSDWYLPEDYNGETGITTVAADLAVERGVFIANSAGNRGSAGLVVPADGFHVCAVGGVYSTGLPWSGSSRGPTADGRIKPDVAAMGVGVSVANSLFRDSPQVLYDSTSDIRRGDIQVTVNHTVPTGRGSEHLWIAFTLEDNSTEASAWLGKPVLGNSGVTVHLIRDGTPAALWMNDFSDPSVLTAPFPNGFGYEGESLSFTDGGIETTIPNHFDISLLLDLTSTLPPGGILDGDVIMVRTTTWNAPAIDLQISYIDDSARGSFVTGSGTSYASPLVAGTAALILEAHPGWTPFQVLDALRSTASQASSPDNAVGWGIVNAGGAVFDSGQPASPDLSGDGAVGEADLLLFLRDWDVTRSTNESPFGPSLRSDLNLDSRIDGRDLFEFSTGWGE